MRNISPASLAKISGTNNIEPVIIVRIWWGDTTYVNYADKRFTSINIVGKLVQISGIEDVVDINASSSSVNLSITLDDSDGSIKNIFDNNDIHKTFVQVLQWFADLPTSDAFSLFEGEISSPIIWSEGDRTLKFDVVSMLEDQEVGYSADESQFSYMPSDLIGKAWPIVFGTVAGMSPIAINESPSAILAAGFGVVDDDLWDAEIANLKAAIKKADDNSTYAYQLGESEAIIATLYKEFGPGNFPDDPAQAAQHDNAASAYFIQADQYKQESQRLSRELASKLDELDFQHSTELRVLPITQTNLPSGVTFTAEIGKYICQALVINNVIILSNLEIKVDINDQLGTTDYTFGNQTNEYSRKEPGQKYVWIDGGTTVKIYEYPVQYIVSIGHVNVLNVYAQSKYGKALVPANYYVVTYDEFHPQSGDLVNFSSLKVTYITIPIPLETLDSDYWQSGPITVDCTGNDPGTNTVDIMVWAIQNFSGLSYDNDSFVYVKDKVAGFPANFVLSDRKNVMTFLKDVAFQSRCAIWLNDRKFYLQFLPEDLAPIEMITDADAELNSLVITSTESERLVTKFVAKWKSLISQSEPNQIVLRYNILNYGSIEEEYDFYIYNQYAQVMAAAQFWMIRKSNTWKLVQCKVALNKLKIEAFDFVTFSFNENLLSVGPIVGQITKSTFNPDDDSLTLEAWLPIRFGEMIRYEFAFPGTTSNVYPAINDGNVVTGNPYADAYVALDPNLHFPPLKALTITTKPPTHGTNQPANANPASTTLITALPTSEIGKTRPEGVNTFNNTTNRDVKPVVVATSTPTMPNTFYAEVIEKKEDKLYSCSVYVKGLTGTPQTLDVKLGKIKEGSTLPKGYPLSVNRSTWVDNGNVTQFEYWAQPPLWRPFSESDT